MPPQMILTALLLLAPTFALAEGCDKSQTEATMSCASGSSWNPEAKICETTSS